jgi:hypothetical protein
MLDALIAYGAQVFVATIAFVGIWKDWHEKNKRDQIHSKHVYVFLTLLTFGLLTLTLIDTQNTRKHAAEAKIESRDEIKRLETAVSIESANNDKQYDRNQKELLGLRDQVSDLKTESATTELRKKITTLEAQLDKSLTPAPKATLVFSFFPFAPSPENANVPVPVTDIAEPLSADGAFHVNVGVANQTEVDAVDGEIVLQICDVCKFTKLPDGFIRHEGQSDQIINMPFVRVLAKTILPRIALDLTVPSAQYGNINLAMTYRCRTCVIESNRSIILVRLTRDTLQMPPNLRGRAKTKN